MVTEPEQPVEQPKEVVEGPEPFTFEKSKERAAEAVDRVKQASRDITTRPILEAFGSYINRGIDAIIGLAEGIEGKAKKKDDE